MTKREEERKTKSQMKRLNRRQKVSFDQLGTNNEIRNGRMTKSRHRKSEVTQKAIRNSEGKTEKQKLERK